MARQPSKAHIVVRHLVRLKGEKAPSAFWAAETKAAKELLNVPENFSEEDAELVKVYTVSEITGCLDALFAQGISVWTLRLFTAAPKILRDYTASPQNFVVPKWLIKKRDDKHVRILPGF
jgi:hypothetical protein